MRRLNFAAFALVAALAVALLAPSAAWGQASSGNLEGQVLDADGSPLPGATVTATNRATGVSRVETSDANGSYRFASLPAGAYDIQVELSGFGTIVQESVTV